MLRNFPGTAAIGAGSRAFDIYLVLHQPWLGRLGKAAARVWHMAERRRQRLALLELDSRLLRDIGLTRSDVRHECAKPFWRS